MKGTLDDEIISILEQKNFTIDNKSTDLKILVALIACVLGAVSHFYPIPFPKNKLLLIGCVAGYMLCATLYYLIEKYMEKDSFFIAKSHNINAVKDFQRVVFSSSFDSEHGANYELKIESTNSKGNTIKIEQKFPVTTFYDELGYLHRYKVREAVEEALQKFIKTR